jgi:transcriptional regulator with XRE-family HTH domain
MKPILQTSIAKAIKSIRTEKGMSQEELAHACELDRTYISGIERQARNPTVKTLEKIIASIDVSEADFLEIVLSIVNDEYKSKS